MFGALILISAVIGLIIGSFFAAVSGNLEFLVFTPSVSITLSVLYAILAK